MKIGEMALALVALALVAPCSAHAAQLSLICAGVGTFPEAQTRSAIVTDLNTGQSATGSTTDTAKARVQSTVRFELTDAGARILMPHFMTPPINRGSDGGWWTFDRLSVTPDQITGRFALNFANKPEVTIDRRLGTILVQGNFHYSFAGECERGAPPDAAPKF